MSKEKYPHYYKAIPEGVTEIDVYRVLEMFEVKDPCLAHAIKKLMVPGERGAKDIKKDVKEAVDTLQRRLEMWDETDRSEVPYIGPDRRKSPDNSAKSVEPSGCSDEGWIPWHGGSCPVDERHAVKVKVASGEIRTGRADWFCWDTGCGINNIIAYKLA